MTKPTDLVTVSGGIAVSGNVADFFKNNAQAGSENLSAALPQLKVTEGNSQNEGTDGQYVAAGQFYYSPTKEAFKEIRASIMTISRGFWAMDNSDSPKPKFTQLVGGMMLDTLQPFVMFVSGTRLQNMWNFGKEIKPFTSNKQTPVPMFAFEVLLGLDKNKTNYGVNHIVTYKVVRNEKNQVVLISDLEVLNLLRNGIDQLESTFESFIEQKEVDRNTGKLLKDQEFEEGVSAIMGEPIDPTPEPEEADVAEPTQEELASTKDEINVDDIPF